MPKILQPRNRNRFRAREVNSICPLPRIKISLVAAVVSERLRTKIRSLMDQVSGTGESDTVPIRKSFNKLDLLWYCAGQYYTTPAARNSTSTGILIKVHADTRAAVQYERIRVRQT